MVKGIKRGVETHIFGVDSIRAHIYAASFAAWNQRQVLVRPWVPRGRLPLTLQATITSIVPLGKHQ